MDGSNLQQVELSVTKKKFETELGQFLKLQELYRNKGVLLLKKEFPIMEFAFIAPQLNPPSIAFTVSFDFTNYDVEPMSLAFIDPLSGRKLRRKELLVGFFQKEEITLDVQGLALPGTPLKRISSRPILMGRPDDIPFICLPGVKEFHQNVAHTGEPWLLYRNRGEGRLITLIDQLYEHSIPFVNSYRIDFNVGLNQIMR